MIATQIKIQKRNGNTQNYNPEKIKNAIANAVKAVGGQNFYLVELLTTEVELQLQKKYNGTMVSIEDIQDLVEKVLIESGHAKTAKAFILYRYKRTEGRKAKRTMMEMEQTIEEYLEHLDWKKSESNPEDYSLGELNLRTAGKITHNYWFSKVFPKAVVDAHNNGDFHIHDLDQLSGYSIGWNLKSLLENGFEDIKSRIERKAPNHLHSALSQLSNFLAILQSEWAGPQTLTSFDTYLAPFVKKFSDECREEAKRIQFSSDKERENFIDEKTHGYVRQNLKSFVFDLNTPSFMGINPPNTHLVFDLVCPENLRNDSMIISGKQMEKPFSSLQKEMNIINKVCKDILSEGDAKGEKFYCPKISYKIHKNYSWENESSNILYDLLKNYGVLCLHNYRNEESKSILETGENTWEKDTLYTSGNGIFWNETLTGSMGVVTINLAKIGYMYKGNEESFFERLDYVLYLSRIALELKRKVLNKLLDEDFLPYSKKYLGDLKKHFSTIGIIGMNESIRNFSGDRENIQTEFGQNFSEEILIFIHNRLIEFQKETGTLYNLSATPHDKKVQRLAKEDKKRYPEILTDTEKELPGYSNSSLYPKADRSELELKINCQKNLQWRLNGGTELPLSVDLETFDRDSFKKWGTEIFDTHKLPCVKFGPIHT